MTVPSCSSNGIQQPPTSIRIQGTDVPCIAATKALVASVPGTLSLAQGVVHWKPPSQALENATNMISDPSASSYGPDEGLPALRQALREKLRQENGLEGYDVHVTAGANQAFANVVLALLDATDTVVLFVPYYFNHRMAIQMTGGANNIIYAPCDSKSFHPDLDWLEQHLSSHSPPKMVVIVNPNNPTGVLMSKEEVERAAGMCSAAGAWLVMDNTYEHFVYDDRAHHCVAGPHIIHLFSFSKAFGMMGWRQGYIAFPDEAAAPSGNHLASQLIKVQDTIPICATQLSQHVSLGALAAGRNWVSKRVAALEGNRRVLLDALSTLGVPGDGIAPSEGAIYLWARLPEGCDDDEAVVEWLVRKHKVCLIPGTACGCPGHVRVAFGNLQDADCVEAAARLKGGLEELKLRGMAGVVEDLKGLRLPLV